MTQPNQKVDDDDDSESDSPPSTDPPSALEFLKAISGAAGVLTALAFISGWLYWAIYYSAFGMNPLVMDFPVAVISVSPFWVLVRDAFTQEGAGATAILVIVLMLCVLLGSLFAYTYAHRRPYATLLLICMSILMTGGAIALGVHDARLDSGCNSRLADVSFTFNGTPDPDAPPPPCQQMDCKLVIHLGNVYHYFPTPSCDSSTPLGVSLVMGEYFESDVKSVQINRRGF